MDDENSYKKSWFAKPWADPLHGFLMLLWAIVGMVWLIIVTPLFLHTVGHLFSTDLSFREYMEIKPRDELLTRWESVMLWFFCLFILCLGYKKLIVAKEEFGTRRYSEDRENEDRIWNELDSLTKKELLDLAKEKGLGAAVSMKSKKDELKYVIFNQIKRENRQ